jgi:hypothetical protein
MGTYSFHLFLPEWKMRFVSVEEQGSVPDAGLTEATGPAHCLQPTHPPTVHSIADRWSVSIGLIEMESQIKTEGQIEGGYDWGGGFWI